MPGRYLLDTNIVIEMLNGAAGLRFLVDSMEAVFLSSIAIGELYYGAAHSQRKEANTARIDSLITGFSVLRVDATTAFEYGQVKSQLKQAGRPIPENDLWIAATAIQHELVLITRDRHFNFIERLQIEKPG